MVSPSLEPRDERRPTPERGAARWAAPKRSGGAHPLPGPASQNKIGDISMFSLRSFDGEK